MNSPREGKQKVGIGLFGGTFDPVHYGHLRAALEVRDRVGLDDFRLLPAGIPPHREKPVAPAADRRAMLQLAVADCAGFRVDDRELRRPGFSYMVDTLAEVRSEEGRSPLVLILGQDAANLLDGWHEWRKIFDLAHLVIMRRPDSSPSWSGELQQTVRTRLVDSPDRLLGEPAGCVLPLEVTQLAITSTSIRRQFGDGHSPRFLMPDSVMDYVLQKKLYFAGKARKG